MTRSVSRGQLLFREGDDGEALYVVVEGLVKIFVSSPEGAYRAITTLGPPDVFGELPLIDEGPRSASAVAVVESTLLALDRTTLLDVVRRHPDLLDGLLRSLGGALRRLTEQAADLVFLDLHGRVAKLVVGLVEREGTDGGSVLDLQLTQTDLAEMVGGSRQSVNQILHSFERRGFIEMEGRQIRILDVAGLRRRANL